MANFNLTFYKGDDGYSDGDANENYILEAVTAGKGLDDIPENEMSWPVFYHLSPIRESICNWYPFKKDASILEIGSGCGAITGVLCQNADKVTSVELSKRRASINYERNKQYDNLDIIVGNLNDISFEEKFDYITLIGVLEYAGRFTDSDKPFHTFLNNIKNLLKPDGALLVAIENRLGLKYFSGAPEDHTGRLFDGINNYPDYNGVRTFSKSELINLFRECGFNHNRFYYPYPDYKLPNEIFTDYSIKRNKRPYLTYDVDRYSLFWEADLDCALQNEDVAAVFSNSFFVEVREDTECDNSVLYAKLNQDRKEQFRVGTVIYEKCNELKVEKKAFNPTAIEHIDRISENDLKPYGSIRAIRGTKQGKSIQYPYITYKTLSDRLKQLALQGNREEIISALKGFFDAAFSGAEKQKYSSSKFEDVFGGDAPEMPQAICICPANIDFSPANIFCVDDGFLLSDCEWVFDFPIPISYIKWRAIRSLYVNIPQIIRTIPESELLEELEISLDAIDIYKSWESHFIDEYVLSRGRGVPKTNKFKRIIFGEEERLNEEVRRHEVQAENYRQEIQRYDIQVENYRQEIQRYDIQAENYRQEIQRYDIQAENYRQEIQRYDVQAENYRNEILSLNQIIGRLQDQQDANKREIIRLKERVNSFVTRVSSAQKIISILAASKAFKLIHLHKRIKEQLILGNAAEKRAFFSWLKNRKKAQQDSDLSYNYLLQLEAAIQGDRENAPEYIESPCDVSIIGAKRIDIITPGHTLFLAKQLSSFLKSAGIESEIHAPEFTQYEQIPYIIICANIMKQLPQCYICYQMEQTINSRWLSGGYIETLEHAKAVLDYSRVNVRYFETAGNLKEKLYYVPMGVSASDMESEVLPDNQNIDVLFYGDINCDRRKRIIAELNESFNVHVESDLFGEDMLNVIRRSKVVINIHYYEGALLETPRIAEILSLGTSIIVSEKSNDPEEEDRMGNFIDLIEVDDIEAMRSRIAFWLDNPLERENKLRENRNSIVEGNVDSKEFFDRFLCEQGII